MAIVNHAKREINAKIVFYGHEGSGKGTSLRYLHERIKPSLRSELKSQPASGGSLLFFDFCPFEQPVFGGYRIRFNIYTLPGRVSNPAAWKMTLKGADGLVLVVAAPEARSAGKQSIVRLRDYLASYGMGLSDIPTVLQVNKADLAGKITTEDIAAGLELGNIPTCLTMALSGNGILETLSTLSRQVMDRLSQENILQQEHETFSTAAATDQTTSSDIGTEAGKDSGANSSTFNSSETVTDSAASVSDGKFEIALADTKVSLDNGTLRIPLTFSMNGQTRRLLVSIAIEPDKESV
jgi:signal recognition particle receptor subunit beta